ncbi:sulfotransferase family protein [Nocardiopsis baichengensis]|uniref:sulfotransferase family protein n=1 Tax=Nocardiopsis baichengensis TaxID=280240 RepID=UPI000345AEFE|nr:sulfotransferase [Nocardiopsis baichengensis]
MKQPPHILVANGTKVRRPVFVLGAPHSGTDLLARALGRAPGFLVRAGHTAVMNAVYTVARRPSLAEERASGTSALLRDAFAEAWSLTPPNCPFCPGTRFPAREAASPCRHAGGITAYGDASPDLLYSAPALSAAFPDAAFVQIIRDGRDVVAEMLDDERSMAWFRPGAVRMEGEPPHPFYGVEDEEERDGYTSLSDTAKCAMRWRGAVRLSARLRGELDAERLMTLRYEDVAGKEVETAEQLRAFTGARVSAVELIREESAGPPSRTRLTTDQHTEIRSVAKTELSRLGYGEKKSRSARA